MSNYDLIPNDYQQCAAQVKKYYKIPEMEDIKDDTFNVVCERFTRVIGDRWICNLTWWQRREENNIVSYILKSTFSSKYSQENKPDALEAAYRMLWYWLMSQEAIPTWNLAMFTSPQRFPGDLVPVMGWNKSQSTQGAYHSLAASTFLLRTRPEDALLDILKHRRKKIRVHVDRVERVNTKLQQGELQRVSRLDRFARFDTATRDKIIASATYKIIDSYPKTTPSLTNGNTLASSSAIVPRSATSTAPSTTPSSSLAQQSSTTVTNSQTITNNLAPIGLPAASATSQIDHKRKRSDGPTVHESTRNDDTAISEQVPKRVRPDLVANGDTTTSSVVEVQYEELDYEPPPAQSTSVSELNHPSTSLDPTSGIESAGVITAGISPAVDSNVYSSSSSIATDVGSGPLAVDTPAVDTPAVDTPAVITPIVDTSAAGNTTPGDNLGRSTVSGLSSESTTSTATASSHTVDFPQNVRPVGAPAVANTLNPLPNIGTSIQTTKAKVSEFQNTTTPSHTVASSSSVQPINVVGVYSVPAPPSATMVNPQAIVGDSSSLSHAPIAGGLPPTTSTTPASSSTGLASGPSSADTGYSNVSIGANDPQPISARTQRTPAISLTPVIIYGGIWSLQFFPGDPELQKKLQLLCDHLNAGGTLPHKFQQIQDQYLRKALYPNSELPPGSMAHLIGNPLYRWMSSKTEWILDNQFVDWFYLATLQDCKFRLDVADSHHPESNMIYDLLKPVADYLQRPTSTKNPYLCKSLVEWSCARSVWVQLLVAEGILYIANHSQGIISDHILAQATIFTSSQDFTAIRNKYFSPPALPTVTPHTASYDSRLARAIPISIIRPTQSTPSFSARSWFGYKQYTFKPTNNPFSNSPAAPFDPSSYKGRPVTISKYGKNLHSLHNNKNNEATNSTKEPDVANGTNVGSNSDQSSNVESKGKAKEEGWEQSSNAESMGKAGEEIKSQLTRSTSQRVFQKQPLVLPPVVHEGVLKFEELPDDVPASPSLSKRPTRPAKARYKLFPISHLNVVIQRLEARLTAGSDEDGEVKAALKAARYGKRSLELSTPSSTQVVIVLPYNVLALSNKERTTSAQLSEGQAKAMTAALGGVSDKTPLTSSKPTSHPDNSAKDNQTGGSNNSQEKISVVPSSGTSQGYVSSCSPDRASDHTATAGLDPVSQLTLDLGNVSVSTSAVVEEQQSVSDSQTQLPYSNSSGEVLDESSTRPPTSNEERIDSLLIQSSALEADTGVIGPLMHSSVAQNEDVGPFFDQPPASEEIVETANGDLAFASDSKEEDLGGSSEQFLASTTHPLQSNVSENPHSDLNEQEDSDREDSKDSQVLDPSPDDDEDGDDNDDGPPRGSGALYARAPESLNETSTDPVSQLAAQLDAAIILNAAAVEEESASEVPRDLLAIQSVPGESGDEEEPGGVALNLPQESTASDETVASDNTSLQAEGTNSSVEVPIIRRDLDTPLLNVQVAEADGDLSGGAVDTSSSSYHGQRPEGTNEQERSSDSNGVDSVPMDFENTASSFTAESTSIQSNLPVPATRPLQGIPPVPPTLDSAFSTAPFGTGQFVPPTGRLFQSQQPGGTFSSRQLHNPFAGTSPSNLAPSISPLNFGFQAQPREELFSQPRAGTSTGSWLGIFEGQAVRTSDHFMGSANSAQGSFTTPTGQANTNDSSPFGSFITPLRTPRRHLRNQQAGNTMASPLFPNFGELAMFGLNVRLDEGVRAANTGPLPPAPVFPQRDTLFNFTRQSVESPSAINTIPPPPVPVVPQPGPSLFNFSSQATQDTPASVALPQSNLSGQVGLGGFTFGQLGTQTNLIFGRTRSAQPASPVPQVNTGTSASSFRQPTRESDNFSHSECLRGWISGPSNNESANANVDSEEEGTESIIPASTEVMARRNIRPARGPRGTRLQLGRVHIPQDLAQSSDTVLPSTENDTHTEVQAMSSSTAATGTSANFLGLDSPNSNSLSDEDEESSDEDNSFPRPRKGKGKTRADDSESEPESEDEEEDEDMVLSDPEPEDDFYNSMPQGTGFPSTFTRRAEESADFIGLDTATYNSIDFSRFGRFEGKAAASSSPQFAAPSRRFYNPAIEAILRQGNTAALPTSEAGPTRLSSPSPEPTSDPEMPPPSNEPGPVAAPGGHQNNDLSRLESPDPDSPTPSNKEEGDEAGEEEEEEKEESDSEADSLPDYQDDGIGQSWLEQPRRNFTREGFSHRVDTSRIPQNRAIAIPRRSRFAAGNQAGPSSAASTTVTYGSVIRLQAAAPAGSSSSVGGNGAGLEVRESQGPVENASRKLEDLDEEYDEEEDDQQLRED